MPYPEFPCKVFWEKETQVVESIDDFEYFDDQFENFDDKPVILDSSGRYVIAVIGDEELGMLWALDRPAAERCRKVVSGSLNGERVAVELLDDQPILGILRNEIPLPRSWREMNELQHVKIDDSDQNEMPFSQYKNPLEQFEQRWWQLRYW